MFNISCHELFWFLVDAQLSLRHFPPSVAFEVLPEPDGKSINWYMLIDFDTIWIVRRKWK